MGNKEFNVGCFSFNNVINLRRYPTVDVVRVVFLFISYEQNTKDYKTYSNKYCMSKTKINLGDKENG